MEHLRYTASNPTRLKRKYQLFSYWQLLGFFLICSAILFFLFPGKSLQESILAKNDLTNADLYYSMSFLKRSDKGSKLYQLIVDNPSAAVNYIDDARNKLIQEKQLDTLWLNYIILRSIYLGPNQQDALKQQAATVMNNYLLVFKDEKLIESRDKLLAQDALTMNNSPLALSFLEQVVEQNPNQSLDYYTRMAQVALWAKQCERSSELYFLAKHKATAINDSRYLFFSAVDALVRCDKAKMALDLGLKNMDGLEQDIETYKKLTEVALQANDPAKARDLILRLMQLRSNTSE